MVVMVAITISLPALSGLVTYKKNPEYVEKKRNRLNKMKNNSPAVSDAASVPYTYEAPDANFDIDDLVSSQSSAFSGVRSKLKNLHAPKITENDIPVKLELVGESELKRRVRGSHSRGKIAVDINPTTYDYDIDELIDEELEKDREEAREKFGTSEV